MRSKVTPAQASFLLRDMVSTTTRNSVTLEGKYMVHPYSKYMCVTLVDPLFYFLYEVRDNDNEAYTLFKVYEFN